MARFSDQALRRYSRQILLREVGGHGQARIAISRLDLIAANGGGSVASVAAQYLLRAGVAEVRWFAEAAATAEPLLRLAEVEAPPLASQGLPSATASTTANTTANTTASSEGLLARGRWQDRPDFAHKLDPGLRCVAAWRLTGEHTPPWWVTENRCRRERPEAGVAVPAVGAGAGGDGDGWDSTALTLGSALALGLLQELLGCTPATWDHFADLA